MKSAFPRIAATASAVAFVSVLACLLAAAATPASAQSITAFSPQGEIKGVRQVTARFATAMVPFGDPRAVSPFVIDCAAKGVGRWADPRNWVYDFDADLPAGVRCTFTPAADLKDLAGKPVDAHAAFLFNTGGPAILQQLPYEGSRIDEHQMFILGLDAPADPATIPGNAWCSASGVNERIGVRLVTGPERRKVLDARRGSLNEYLRVLLLDPKTGRTTSLAFTLPPGSDERSRFLKLRDAPDSPLVVVACTRTLPAGATMKLVWGAGITTTTGIANTKDQAIAYEVRPAFRASFTCERANKDAQCIPIRPLHLAFSAPISRRDAQAIRLTDANGNAYVTTVNGEHGDDWVEGVSFGPALPEMSTFRIELPPNLHDDAGRTLANARLFPLKVRTDQAPPLVKFAADFGILESHADADGPLLPVTVRNVEANLAGKQATVSTVPAAADTTIPGKVLRVMPGDEKSIIAWLRRLDDNNQIDARFDTQHERWIINNAGVARSLFGKGDTTAPMRVPVADNGKAFEVVGIPLKAPGFYVVELASPRLGAALFGTPRPYYARSAALVTNLAVHFKRGRENSLVWVTRLDDAKPVAHAHVSVEDCGGRVHWQGDTDDAGIAHIAAQLAEPEGLPKCNKDSRAAYFVVARTDDDMAFAFSDWDSGIAPWRYNLPTGGGDSAYVAHAVFDRTLVRAGDTVSMKVFVRRQTGQGFAFVAADALGGTLTIQHDGTDREFTALVNWHASRYGEATFVVPKDAPLGTYRVVMHDSLGRNGGARDVGTFRVEQFRVPLMRARIQAVGGPFVNAGSVPLDLQVSYLAGGGAGGLPVTLRTQTRARDVSFPDYDDYAFAAGDVREGRSDHTVEEADADSDEPDDTAQEQPAADGNVTTTPLTLDAKGGARTVVNKLPHADQPRELVAEAEYRDPNGETSTASTHVALWNAALVLGIKPDSWVASNNRVKFTVVALDPQGKPAANVTIAVDAFKRETYSHRRRLIGGFYSYQSGTETTRVGELCSGTTNAQGLLLCDKPITTGGNLVLRAKASDATGNPAVTQREIWVANGEDAWFDSGDNDRIDLLPERKQYAPGEIARFQVRTPFREATALVTVEREGILDSFVTHLSRDNPVIDVPMKGSYAPNVFISAFIVRGRIGDVQPTALIDLGKPSFKMGIAQVRVGWVAHTLDVKVASDKPVYRTRENAQVDIEVRRADGGVLPAGSDVAIAAVDEGLLELLPNNSWKLLDAMMAERSIEVDTSTAEMQVIGRRHFGRKAVASGGGGGRQSARELFDTLLAWHASVALDANGHAHVDIPLNDSLTGFRIVAIADAGDQWFGTGETSIRATQPLMLLSGLPQVLREGDHLRAGFTVRDASAEPQAVTVTATVSNAAGVALPTLAPQHVDLKGGEARDLGWDIDVPVGAGTLQWRVDATGTSGDGASAAQKFSDALAVKVPVNAAIPDRTYQATMMQLDKPLSIPVERPADAVPGRGGIDVTVQNKLAGDLPGVREFFERYPFDCFEQRASIAIGLKDRATWDALVAQLPAYLDDDGLVRFWPFLTRGDDYLTAYVLSVADEAGYPLPEESRKRMEAGMIGFIEGRVIRYSALPTADLTLRKLTALEALSRRKTGFSAHWLDSLSIEPNLWPTSAVIDWYLVQKRQPALPQRDARMAEAQQILRSRLNFQGTTMNFSTEHADALWWLMVNGDVNANRLVLAMADEPAWKEDMPRIVRGALGRMQRGRWSTTVANTWGTLALDRFSAAFESVPVTGATAMTLGDAVKTEKFAGGSAVQSFTDRMPWPPARADLGLAHSGTGAPWVTIASIAAIPLKQPLSSGYAITRTITPVQQKVAGQWSVGDVARVHLTINAQSDMTWVAVSDPIPSGATILGRGFGTDSTLATRTERSDDETQPAHEERGNSDYRAFYRYLPKGLVNVEYSVRLNNAGQFALPGTRTEAMYAPEMFGELPGSAWVVVQ